MTAHLKAKHRKFTVGKRKAEEIIPEIDKYIKHPGWAKNSNELDSVPFVFNSQWF